MCAPLADSLLSCLLPSCSPAPPAQVMVCYCPRASSAQLRACAGLSAAAVLLLRGAELREGSVSAAAAAAADENKKSSSAASGSGGGGATITTTVTAGFSVAEASRAVQPFCALFDFLTERTCRFNFLDQEVSVLAL
jgi:hypothetical protein